MDSDKITIRKSLNKTVKFSAIPSSSSKNSVIKGPKFTRWGTDVPKSNEPYRNRLFETPYKPPPNEQHYLGGHGVHNPRFRSKVHPARTTTIQQLHRQRTGNRINFSLTEDPTIAKQSMPKRKTAIELPKSYVDRVCFADNLDSPKSPRSLTPTSSGSSIKTEVHPTHPHVIRKSGSLLPDTADPAQNYLTTKRRASAQGLLQDLQQFSLEPDSPRENDILDLLERVRGGKGEEKSLGGSLKCFLKPEEGKLESKSEEQGKRKLLAMKNINNNNQRSVVDGALYGPIVPKRSQGIAAKLSEKFQLPKAMVDRLAKKNSAKNAQQESNRKSMRGHMNKPFPTSDSSSEEEERPDEYEEVKSLTLVRTGYCTIPTIKYGKRRRKDRLKTNRFLSKHQLNRIRYLFFDERQKWAKPEEIDLDKEPPPMVLSRQGPSAIKCSDKVARSEQSFDQGQPKLYTKLKQFIREHRKNKEVEDNKGNSLTFDGFKKGLLSEKYKKNKEDESVTNSNQGIKKVSIYGEDQKGRKNKGLSKKFRIAQPQKLFKQSRTRQSFRGIDARDSQYVDPNFMTKQRFPELNAMKESQYTLQCTIRYHTNMRKRLQVNTVDYEEERFGFSDEQYLHCLATEWDENYVNELQATKKFKKFRVKSDIIRMREVMRKNFNQYYILENLANLRHKQRHEEAFIDNLNQFAGMCVDYLERMKVQAYDSLIEKTNHLKPLETTTLQLKQREKSLRAQLEHVTESLLGIEQRWDTIMRLQNYYYALMGTEWRKRNDWIHRKSADGQLEVAIYSVDRCRSANIRDKSDPSGFAIIEYFNGKIFPNLDRMRAVEPDKELLQKGLHAMQSEVFTYLNQYNKTLWLFDKISQTFAEQSKAIADRLEAKKKQIYFRQKKQEFLEERNHVLQYEANQITRKPLEEAIKNLQMRRVAAVVEEMYKNVMPQELRSPEIDKDLGTIAKFSRLHQYVMDVLHALDKLPVAVLKFTETRTRQQRKKVLDEGRAAVVKQTRFELLQNQLRGFFRLLQPMRKDEPSMSLAVKTKTILTSKTKKKIIANKFVLS